MQIHVNEIAPNPAQPRTIFDDAEIEALAATMAEDGLLNAVSLVGPYAVDGGASYYLIDGERRWRAARLLGWETLEATIRPPNGDGESDMLFRALIGNLQREDTPPVDEARAFAQLRDAGYSAEEIAERVGKSAAMVYQRLKLLEFPEIIQHLFNQRLLPLDYEAIRALRKLMPEDQIEVARRAAAHQMSGAKIKAVITRKLNRKPLRYRRKHHNASNGDGDEDGAPALVLNDPLGEAYEGSQIEEHITKTCKACGMGTMENGSVCRACPLTEFVKRLG